MEILLLARVVEIDANLNKVSEIERRNPAAKGPCRYGKNQLEAGITRRLKYEF